MITRRSGPAQEYAHICIKPQAYHRKAFLNESLAYWIFVLPVCGSQKASELHKSSYSQQPTKKKKLRVAKSFIFFFFNYLCAVIYFDIVEFFYIPIWNCRSVEIPTEAKLSTLSFVPTSHLSRAHCDTRRVIQRQKTCCYDFRVISSVFLLTVIFVPTLWG